MNVNINCDDSAPNLYFGPDDLSLLIGIAAQLDPFDPAWGWSLEAQDAIIKAKAATSGDRVDWSLSVDSFRDHVQS